MLSLKVALLLALLCISNVKSQTINQQARSGSVGQAASSSQASAVLTEEGDLSQIEGLAEAEQSLDQSSTSENEKKPQNPEAPIVGQSLLNNFGSQLMPCPLNIFNCFPALSSLLSWGRTFPTNSLLGAALDSAPEASKVVLVLADDEPLNNAKDFENVSSNRVVRQNNMFDDLFSRVQQSGQVYQDLLQQITARSGASSQSSSGSPDLLAQAIEGIQPWTSQLLPQGSDGTPGNDFVSQAMQSLNQQSQSLTQLLQPGGDTSGLSQLIPQLTPDRLMQQIMGPLGQAPPTVSQQSDPASVGSPIDPPASDSEPEAAPEPEAEAPTATAEAKASSGPTLGQSLQLPTLNPGFPNIQQFTKVFSGFTSPLNIFQQPLGQASEINEVRVKPDTPYTRPETLPLPSTSSLATDKLNDMKTIARLQEALQKKNIPILWFRLPSAASPPLNTTSKSIEDLKIEKKLKDFERQVVAELQLLQELERLAKQMEAVTKNQKTKPSKESLYKLSYPLSRTPVHKITRGDIEKALNDEYFRRLLEKTSMNQKQTQRDSMPSVPNTNPFKRQTASETIPKPMTKEDIIKMMLYAYRMSQDKDGEMLSDSRKDNANKSQTAFRNNIADAKLAAERQRQNLQMPSMMKQKLERTMDMNQQRQWVNMPQQAQRQPAMGKMQKMALNPNERQWMEPEQAQRQQMPMDIMGRQWLEEQNQRNMQQRQWAEQSMKHIQNFNANQQPDPQMQVKQMDSPMKMQGERQWMTEGNKNPQTEQQRQWIDMQRPNQMEQQSQMKTMKDERHWMEGMMKNNLEEQQRQWITTEQQQQQPSPMKQPIDSTKMQDERQWMDEKNKNLAENQQRQWLETQQQQQQQQPQQQLEVPNSQTSSMTKPSVRNMDRKMMDDSLNQADPNMEKVTNLEMQRQWADKNMENAPKPQSGERQWANQMQAEQRQWAEKNPQHEAQQMQPQQRQWANGNMETPNRQPVEQRQWAEGKPQSPEMNQRQWAEKNPQHEAQQMQPQQRQWANGNMETPNRQPAEQRQWAEGKPQSPEMNQRQWAEKNPQHEAQQMQPQQRQWANGNMETPNRQPAEQRQWAEGKPQSPEGPMATLTNQRQSLESQQPQSMPQQVPMEQQRQWADPALKSNVAMQTNMNMPMNMESAKMNPQAPVVGEATPQMPENAEKARHKGIFDDLDIFDLDGGSKKSGKDKNKNSHPTIINYYYGGGYPSPSYGGSSYNSRPSYGTSYGGGSYGGGSSYGSGGSYGGSSYGGSSYGSGGYGSSGYSGGSSYGPSSYSYSSQPSSYSSHSYGSNSYGSGGYSGSGNYRSAVGDEQIQALLRSGQPVGKLITNDSHSSNLQTINDQSLNVNEENDGIKRRPRLASLYRLNRIIRSNGKLCVKCKRHRRSASYGTLQPIDERSLEELRKTYKNSLKEITLSPDEDPAEALMRYNSAAIREALEQASQEPLEITGDSEGVEQHTVSEYPTHSGTNKKDYPHVYVHNHPLPQQQAQHQHQHQAQHQHQQQHQHQAQNIHSFPAIPKHMYQAQNAHLQHQKNQGPYPKMVQPILSYKSHPNQIEVKEVPQSSAILSTEKNPNNLNSNKGENKATESILLSEETLNALMGVIKKRLLNFCDNCTTCAYAKGTLNANEASLHKKLDSVGPSKEQKPIPGYEQWLQLMAQKGYNTLQLNKQHYNDYLKKGKVTFVAESDEYYDYEDMHFEKQPPVITKFVEQSFKRDADKNANNDLSFSSESNSNKDTTIIVGKMRGKGFGRESEMLNKIKEDVHIVNSEFDTTLTKSTTLSPYAMRGKFVKKSTAAPLMKDLPSIERKFNRTLKIPLTSMDLDPENLFDNAKNLMDILDLKSEVAKENKDKVMELLRLLHELKHSKGTETEAESSVKNSEVTSSTVSPDLNKSSVTVMVQYRPKMKRLRSKRKKTKHIGTSDGSVEAYVPSVKRLLD